MTGHIVNKLKEYYGVNGDLFEFTGDDLLYTGFGAPGKNGGDEFGVAITAMIKT
jgi:hypothetical protein